MSRTPMLTKHGKALIIACLALLFSHIQTLAQNPVVTENAMPGTPAAAWDVSGAGDLSIQGFATEFSINTGETVDFKVDVKAPATGFNIKIYRLGYYNNTGARLIADLGSFTGVAQPALLYEEATGKTDCSNWSVSASWNSTGAVSGLYIARLTRDDNQGASLIPFIVRDDSRTSKIIFKTSDATWQAYNGYGGNSLYVNNSGTPVPGFNHATKVSYNRPFTTRNGGGGSGSSEDFLFHAEFPMIRWMERNGYDVSYISDVDMDRDATPITPSTHKIFLSVGHDEYWSANARLRAEAARNSGTHLAFFSGNEVYWKTRWEDNHRTLVCYKEGTSGENTCGGKCDPLPDVWTGLWRDGCDFPTADGCNPENKLTGQISWTGSTGTIEVPEKFSQLRFWRHTTITSLGSGQTATLANNTLGYEWDPESNNGKYPPGRIKLSATVLSGQTHHLSLYRHNNGALVFGAGTVQWSWGLDANHDGSSSAEDERMQQATVNLFADMGVLPDNLQSGLTADSPTDNTAPVSVITSPVNGASVPAGNPVYITGTATDVNGVVAGIEVSTDGGLTWQAATGTNSWTYTWTPAASGTVNIQCRAIDDNANMESVSPAPSANSIHLIITAAAPLPCPCTIFPPSATPAVLSAHDGQAIELGMKFRSSQNGFITGVRFYKATGDPGTHTGQLWTSSGSLLASVVFTNETASGWQQMDFNAPVAITANTTYVIAYHSSANYYTFTDNYFTAAVTNGSLTALADGTDGPNGVYMYTSAPAFPTETYQKSNYWVDVIFNNSAGPDINPPQISSVAPVAGAINVSVNTTVQAIFNEPLDALTINNTTVELRDGSNVLIPAAITYNSGTRTISITPNSNLAYSANYTALLKGGISSPHITDVAGNAMTNDYSWSFTTASEPPPPPAEGPGGPILVISAAANPFSRYAVEMLRAEGLNEFTALDISQVNATVLNNYDVVILGEMSLNGSQVSMLSNWVNAGGLFIAFRPDAQLAGLLGITPASGTLSDKYILVNTASAPGTGITGQTIQFHSAADLYTLNGATTVAVLYSNASTATTYPAVTSHAVGTNGGMAFAFTYDLAKSIVYTRQGNPAWAGQERDGHSDNIRSSDMFFPDWIDLDKVAIPQADEQQHLLNNMILAFNRDRRPLPKFWFLPRKLKAAIVMTGDDHGNGGTIGRFNQYIGYGNNTPADVQDWRAIRGTSYIFTSTPISNAQAAAFEAQGFEIGLHVNTGCTTYTLSSLENTISSQLADFGNKYTSVSSPVTNRTHCISWADWASKPKVEITHGIRLNTDYYYWPAEWVLNRPGMFTGSGMPMRFADLDGTILDNYQVTTQMPDESGISFPGFINTLLDNATGANGYYGVFCANMHTDANTSSGSDAIIASAISRNIPVVSARQMLTWLDGRNGSSFGSYNWNGHVMNFTASIASGAYKIQGMVPATVQSGQLTSLTLNGSPVSYTIETIKGISYAFFDAASGNYAAAYSTDDDGPVITDITATPHTDGTATITWTTNEAADSKVDYNSNASSLSLNQADGSLVTSHTITLTGLSSGTVYYFRVTSADASANTETEPEAPATLQFTMPAGPCASDNTAADFNAGTTDAGTMVIPDNNGSVSLKPAVTEEFSGSSAPGGWTDAIWDGQSGAITTYSSGQITVNGTHLSYNTPVSPGTTLEFTASFTAGNFQNIGFTGDAAFNNPWIVIGRGGAGDNNVYARTSANQSDLLGSDLLNAPHIYKIQWLANGSFAFYVDGVLKSTPSVTQTVNTNMLIQISDYPAGGVGLTVDRICSTPYANSGSFTSRIFNAGIPKNWVAASWNSNTPSGTTLQVSVRTASSATLILSQPWTVIASNGDNVGATAQFIQYKADMATSNTAVTPVLSDISFTCSTPENIAPVVTTDPVTQTVCAGLTASFTSSATGNPAPAVQWQVSTNQGNNWSDIPGAVNTTCSFVTATGDDGKQFRAVWTNTSGTQNSAVATLHLNETPQGTIAAVNSSICTGGTIALQLAAASGGAPYTLVVNGNTYTNVNPGQTFASFNAGEQSIWGSGGSPANPSVTDNQSIEVGTKFRSAQSGYITGIRFYKGATNTGAHIATLWNSAGASLATATFTAESASGWQEVRFNTPVAIQANTTYIASYYSQYGYFAISQNFFTGAGVTNGSLTALQAGVDGPNGVYKYGGGFPDQGSNANYWVDVLYSPVNGTNLVFNLTSITAATGCTNTGNPLGSTTVTINTPPNGTITAVNPAVCENSPVSLNFHATSGTGPFTLTVNGNTYSGINSDQPFNAGNAVFAPVSMGIFYGPGVTGGSQNVDNTSTELGMKFHASVNGTVSGIRFYKTGTDVLNYTGSIWLNGNTTALATAAYTSDNTVGWKQINFASPVSVTAGTTYIVSYFSPSPGYYAYTANGLASPFTNSLLTAESSCYNQPGTGYPASTSVAKYWVDPVFTTATAISVFNLTDISSASGCTNSGNPVSTTQVLVNAVPHPAISSSVNSPVCTNTSVVYSTEAGKTNYQWSLDGIEGTDYQVISGGTGNSSNTVTVNWLTSGTKHVSVNYQNAEGCSGTPASVTTTIHAASASITNNTGTAILDCNHPSICLTAAGGVSYVWNNSLGNTASVNISSPGVYSVLVTDANGCSATAQISITQNMATPGATIINQTGSTQLNCNTTSIHLTASGNGSCSWDGGLGNQEDVYVTIPGTYTLTVTGTNGCTSITSVTITQSPVLTAGSTATVILCHGGTATVTVTANGGTAPYLGTGIFNVTAGTHTYSVTDANGCTASTTITVSEPEALTATSSATAIACHGGNATVTVSASGGTAPYSGTGTFNVIAGSYTYNVTDANGCTTSTSITVTEPDALQAFSSASAVACHGGNATVTVSASGGTEPYTGTGSFIVTAGTYTYNVTDANGCTTSTTITVSEPDALTASSSATAIACHGGNATVTVSASGGTAPYTGTGTFNVTAGTYTYNVTDANGCTTSTTITVTEPIVLLASSSATAIACHGGNATVTVSASGGTAPYTGTGTFNATAGTYTYNVSDANGCTTSTTITVSEPDAIQASSSATAIACHGGNATVTVSASGGTAPYTGTGIFNVTAGTYTYNVTDANGCTTSTTITVTEPDALIAASSATAIVCHGGNATVTVSASGGTAPYTGTGTFNVTAGTYTYNVTDANGCSASASVTISDPPVLNATVTAITQVSCAGSYTGSVTITATGGSPGYTYQLDNGPVISNNQFMGLAAGSYTVTVKDAQNCTKTVNFIITESSNTDLTLGADFSSNLFPADGDEVTVIYNVSEASGKAANPVTLRIFKPAGYNILYNSSQSVASTGFQNYTLDNPQWAVSATNNLYVEFSRTQSGNTLGCNQRMNIAFVIQRATPNRSSFILNVQCRKANGEIILTNNTNSIIMIGE